MAASDSRLSVELALAREIAACHADPLAFVRFIFPWGTGDLERESGPDAWQAEILRDIGKGVLSVAEAIDKEREHEAVRVAVASGHGIGKSALVVWIILWAMSTRPHLNGVVTANTSKQLETKTWRELAVWHKRAINGHWFNWTATKFYHVAHPETWFVAAVPWTEENTEAFAGTHAAHVLLLFDEASAIPDAIWEVAEGAQTTGEVIWGNFGNPTRPTGRFRECFGNGRFAHRWHTWQIDSRECKKANKKQAAEWIEDYGLDSDFVRIRVLGVFPRAGATQLIGHDLVREAQSRQVMPDPGAPLVLGVDIARFGDDQNVLRWRQGRDARSRRPRKFRNLDGMQTASFIVEAINDTDPDVVCVDGNGVGGPVIDRVRALLGDSRQGLVYEIQNGAKAQNERDFFNKRAECWWHVKEWLAFGAIDDDVALRDDLTAPEYGYDPRHNKLLLERKDAMKARGLRSPDDGDALALTFAIPAGRRPQKATPKLRVVETYAGAMRANSSWMV